MLQLSKESTQRKCHHETLSWLAIKYYWKQFVVYRPAMDNSSLEESVFNMFKNPENNLVNIGQILTVTKILARQYKSKILWGDWENWCEKDRPPPGRDGGQAEQVPQEARGREHHTGQPKCGPFHLQRVDTFLRVFSYLTRLFCFLGWLMLTLSWFPRPCRTRWLSLSGLPSARWSRTSSTG